VIGGVKPEMDRHEVGPFPVLGHYNSMVLVERDIGVSVDCGNQLGDQDDDDFAGRGEPV